MPSADQILRAPGDVVLHFLAPLLIAGIDKLLPEAGRAAEVGHQHSVATVSQKLRETIVAPRISAPGTSVGNNNRGQVLCSNAFR